MSNGRKNTIIVVAWPDHSAGHNPEALELAFHHQGPTLIIMHIVKLLRTWVNQDRKFWPSAAKAGSSSYY